MAYRIKMTRTWYDHDDTIEVLGDFDGTSIRPLGFPDIESAEAKIEEFDNTVYYTQHNESGRPHYEIIEV